MSPYPLETFRVIKKRSFDIGFRKKLQKGQFEKHEAANAVCRHLLYFIIFSFPDFLNRDRTFCLFSPLGKTWRILFHPPLRVLLGPLNVLLNFCCYRDYNNMRLASNLPLLS